MAKDLPLTDYERATYERIAASAAERLARWSPSNPMYARMQADLEYANKKLGR